MPRGVTWAEETSPRCNELAPHWAVMRFHARDGLALFLYRVFPTREREQLGQASLDTTRAAAHKEARMVGYFCVFISWCAPPAGNHYTASLKIPNLYNSVMFKK